MLKTLKLFCLAMAALFTSAHAANTTFTVSLPGGLQAPAGGTSISVSVTARDASNMFIDSTNNSFSIAENASSGSTSLTGIPTGAGYTFVVSANCVSNCDASLLKSTHYQVANGEIQTSFPNEDRRITSVPTTISLELVQPETLPVIITLDGSEVAPAGGYTSFVDICRYDQNTRIDCNFEFVQIAESQSQGSADLQYLAVTDPSHHYEVSQQCNLPSCNNFFQGALQYLNTTGTGDYLFSDNNRMLTAELPAVANFIQDTVTTINGTMALPTGFSASGDIVFSTSLELMNVSNETLFFGIGGSSIASGNTSDVFSIDVPTRIFNTAQNYSLSWFCLDLSNGCVGLSTDSYYYTPSGATDEFSNRIQAKATFPASPIALELVAADTLALTFSLPNGVTLAQDQAFNAFLSHYNSAGQFQSSLGGASVTIGTDGANQTDTITFKKPADGFVTLRYGCDRFISPCTNLQTDTNYTPGGNQYGAANIPRVRFPVAQLQSAINLEIETGNTLSGTINLPNGFANNGLGIGATIKIISNDTDGNQTSSEVEGVFFGTSTSSLNYGTTYRARAVDETYEIRILCESGCEGLQRVLYLQSDGSLSPQPAQLSSLPVTQNFTLQTVPTANGRVQLPTGQQASSDISTSVSLSYYADANQTELISSKFAAVTIPAGQNGADFTIELATEESANFVSVNYRCSINCGTLLPDRYFTPGNVLNVASPDRFFNADLLPQTLLLPLENGREINVDLQLPNGALVSDIGFSSTIEYQQGNGLLFDFELGSITAGQTNDTFTFLIPNDNNATVSIRYGCSGNNCGTILGTQFYTPSDVVFTTVESRFDATSLGNNITLVLQEGHSLNGTVSLPNSGTANGDLTVSVSVTALDAEKAFLTSSSTSVTIQDGQTSAPYVLGLGPVNASFYRIETSCFFSCQDVFPSTFHTASGAGVNPDTDVVVAASLGATFDITLLKGTQLTGTVSLPNGLTENDVTAFQQVQLLIFDTNDRIINFSSPGFISFGDDATESNPFSLLLPPLPAGAYAIVEYRCSDSSTNSCSTLVREQYYRSAGTAFTRATAQRLTAPIADISIDLAAGLKTQFQVSRPIGSSDLSTSIFTNIQIEVLDSGDSVIDVQERRLQQINSNSFSSAVVDFTLLGTPSNSGKYRISFSCVVPSFLDTGRDRCDAFIADDPSYTTEINADSLPGLISLQYIAAPEPILADRFEVDNTPELALDVEFDITQLRSIHDAGDQDWLRIVLSDAGPLRIQAVSGDLSDGMPTIVLMDSDQNIIERHDDSFLAEEQDGVTSVIDQPDLAVGNYFVVIEGLSPTSTMRSYTLRVRGLGEEGLCFPVVKAIICF